jgi:hypothetical protein
VWIDEYLHTRLAPLREAYARAQEDWKLPS